MSSISMSQPHFNESIREVDKSSWLILITYLFTRSSSPPPEEVPADQVCWIDSNGGHFALRVAPEPLPDSKPLAEVSSYISIVHAVDNQAAVWRAGEAFIKAHHMDYPDVTREHVTLQFLKDQKSQGFVFPTVFHFRLYSITLRLTRDTSLSSRDFPVNSLMRLGPAWTKLNIITTLPRWQRFAIA